MFRYRAFSLTELLIILAVVAVLAAILFPVFVSAKRSAVETNCVGKFHQVAEAGTMYLSDYDDSFMPVNHQPGSSPNPKTDRTWVQMMLPYLGGTFSAFRCPADNTTFNATEAVFDQDLQPGDLFERYYEASMHVNLGYNSQYLAPIVKFASTWTAEPKSLSSLADPSAMLFFIDSAWEVDKGVASGGGSWLVSPPCRYENVGDAVIDTIASVVKSSSQIGGAGNLFAPVVGWSSSSSTDAGSTFGGAWPRHNGHLTVAMVGGSVRDITINQLSSGCNVQPSWTGAIVDRHAYLWSPE